ncbi:hypothetical protein Tco_1515364 [Tanacetum coccineum]
MWRNMVLVTMMIPRKIMMMFNGTDTSAACQRIQEQLCTVSPDMVMLSTEEDPNNKVMLPRMNKMQRAHDQNFHGNEVIEIINMGRLALHHLQVGSAP